MLKQGSRLQNNNQYISYNEFCERLMVPAKQSLAKYPQRITNVSPKLAKENGARTWPLLTPIGIDQKSPQEFHLNVLDSWN